MTAAERTASLVVPIPSRESAPAKALRLLLTGRVSVLMLHRGRCFANVRGDSGRTYAVIYRGYWRCECQAGARRCAHRRAVELVVDVAAKGADHALL